MRQFISILCLCFLAGCATTPRYAPRAKDHSPIPQEYLSPDRSLALRFQRGSPCKYKLVEAASGKTVATAVSVIRKEDFEGAIFRGTVDVIYAPDSPSVCIEEDVSDASPAKRYILIQPDCCNHAFAVSYLSPEADRLPYDEGQEFDYESPIVVGLRGEDIVFRYEENKRTRTVHISSVHATKVPATVN